jgi:hypothetical protein
MSLYNKMTQKVVIVGTSEVAMPPPAIGDEVQNPEAIFIQAKAANAVDVYIGKSGLQTDDTTGAFVFAPGDNGILPYVSDEKLFLKSTSVGQVIYITYLSDPTPRN